LRQHIYDWGRNKSIIEGYKQDRFVAEIEQSETLNEQLATLLRIAQNTTQEQNLPPYYETLIAIPQPKLSKSDDEVEIVPGMTVMVDLIGQKRTVLNYIMTPLNRSAGVAFREN